MKKILVVGSSGFVGNHMMKALAKKHPNIAIIGMSRTAKPREDITKNLANVSYVKGDCLDPTSYLHHLKDIDGIIHCVGTLVEKRGKPHLSYDALNRDAAINMASVLEEVALERKTTLTFVMISSEKAPPFLDRYLTSKIEAE